MLCIIQEKKMQEQMDIIGNIKANQNVVQTFVQIIFSIWYIYNK